MFSIVANWKMNPESLIEAKALLNEIVRVLKRTKNLEVVICPPFVYLSELKSKISKLKNFKLGAQNCFWEHKGAFTGEISPLMLKNLGCEYVILGHSERRQYLEEKDIDINKKIKSALESGLKVILCVGETLEQRQFGEQKKIVKAQLDLDLKSLGTLKFDIQRSVLIAYEPVWAIGTGNFCQPREALEMAEFIKREVGQLKVLYGGSVTSSNAKNYLFQGKIEGLLVGGASLKSKEFIKIIKSLV